MRGDVARLALLVAGLAVGPACSRTDSGSGTGTLHAIVEIRADETSTTIEAQLQKEGVSVRGANVFVREDDTGATATLESPVPGLYRATMRGYARTIELVITAGEDGLEAVLEGPKPHRITRPPNDARVRRTGFDVLEVEWDADGPAERVELTAGGERVTLEGDLYRGEIPLQPLSNGEHTLGVTRETRVDLEGGTEGSRMRSRYEVDNRFTLEG